MLTAVASLILLGGCAHPPSETASNAVLTPQTAFTKDLLLFPKPKGKITAAVYGFRDQSGQYKQAPESSFSTAVTQGGSALLVKALRDSGWFVPVERENLQNLLTERKIVRALEVAPAKDAPPIFVPQLVAASILIEGGVISFESNIRTGGAGARFLGIGLSTQYRVDQVTINLRTVDIRGGQILQSVSTTKTIYSYEVNPSVFKFVNFKGLLEMEAGLTHNEPAQMCVREAIEAAVAHLIVQGIGDGSWQLANAAEFDLPIMQKYVRENANQSMKISTATSDNRVR
ncbi:curli production assembly/transport protein CsgG [Massilia sp. Leaf139]|nr:curli production assembly/transport protein CsgG [Massilia sp. Leaf139]